MILKKEVNTFLTALMFFTRIPCPAHIDHSEEILAESRKYFPLVGTLIGAISALVFWGATYLGSPILAMALAITASVVATGAFHEDGLADFVDGFGGGWTKEQVLTIMKDSRLGTYGAVSLLLLIVVKISLLYEISKFDFVVVSLLSGHTVSRFVATIIVQRLDYVQEENQSKAKPVASLKFGALKQLYSFIPVIIFGVVFPKTIVAILFSFLPLLYLIPIMKRKIGGYTGDCLGACQQLSEVAFYFGMAILCKFM